MPLYMDIHRNVEGLNKGAVEDAHARDLEVQAKHGTNFINYWFNEDDGTVFCLSEAPDADAVNAAHHEAHGLVADEVVRVDPGD